MARHFKEKDIDEFRECFYLYARSGQIKSLDELSLIMRSVKMCPTVQEMKQYLKNKGGKLNFADFLEVAHIQTQKENVAKEIRAAFLANDTRRTGLIPASELRHILQGWGEKLSRREVDQIFRECNISSNTMVKYEEFCKIVLEPIPDYY
ncbi:calmodulin-like protein 4 [Artemia franciscana]|uniref:EF-hand domain-containing protein n=1 Tax=Artemia franciscana TaxID=6661 RepID=A0AA88H764_ARTSF|nr:hypothetical protein QYM36_018236 [Artemia franciscana]